MLQHGRWLRRTGLLETLSEPWPGWDREKLQRASAQSNAGSPPMTSGSWRRPAPGCQHGLPSPLANWSPMPDEPFPILFPDDQRAALQVAAGQSERPAYLLEKDIWVVRTLPSLVSAPFGEDLTFKGGTKNARFLPVAIYAKEPNQIAEVSSPAPALVHPSQYPDSAALYNCNIITLQY